MSFTDQKQRIATMEEVNSSWNGHPLRCYLCGKFIEVGDKWRWICTSGLPVINLTVCEKCDGPYVIDRWVALIEEFKDLTRNGKFWKLI